MKVGWIGLGGMGTPMALRALARGHEVLGHTRSLQRPSMFAEKGGRLCPSIEDVAGSCDVLAICVFDDSQLREVLLDKGGLAAMREGGAIVVHTTGDPAQLITLADALPAGRVILDAPFSGTASMATEGKLTLLAGGSAAALEYARPVVESYCNSIIHVGSLGAARNLKLLNNLLFASQTSLAAETLRAAHKLGLDIAATAEAINRCSGASYAMGKFSYEESIDTVLEAIRPYLDKDVALARSAMRRAGAQLPIAFSVVQREGA